MMSKKVKLPKILRITAKFTGPGDFHAKQAYDVFFCDIHVIFGLRRVTFFFSLRKKCDSHVNFTASSSDYHVKFQMRWLSSIYVCSTQPVTFINLHMQYTTSNFHVIFRSANQKEKGDYHVKTQTEMTTMSKKYVPENFYE